MEAAKAAQDLYLMVMAEKEGGAKKEGGLPLRALALSVFRQLYRHAWNEPQVNDRSKTKSLVFEGPSGQFAMALAVMRALRLR